METRKPDAAKLTPKKRSPPKVEAPKRVQDSTIEKAMLLLQQQGFHVYAPDLQDIELQKRKAAAALGVVQHTDYRKGLKSPEPKLRKYDIVLTFPHSINGVVYGPGLTTVKDINLLQNLAHKDHIAKEQEARVFETVSRCHLIVTQVDSVGRQAAYAQPVDERFFNTGSALLTAPVFREFSNSDLHR